MITLLICAICELVWIFCYGLLLNSFLPMGVFFFAAFGLPCCVNMIFYKKLPFNDKVNKILWVLIVLTIRAFSKIDDKAADLLLPYLLWVTFAGYLNITAYLLN